MSHAAPTTLPAHELRPLTPWRRVAGLVVGLAVVVTAMLLAFGAPSVHAGPHHVPVGVAGPEQAAQQVEAGLAERDADAFDVTTYSSAAALERAIEHRDVVGGFVVGGDGVTVKTASAAGTPYASTLTGIGDSIAASTGQDVSVDDVVPLTEDDPAGAGLTALALPLAFGGIASSAALTFGLRGVRYPVRAGAALGFAVLAGFAVAALLQPGFGTTDGSYLELAGVLALGIAAISATVMGLESLLGTVGLAIGAVLMMFVANPLSGIATGPAWLPEPWGTIGQQLPIGAAGTALRSVGFFDGHGATSALVVLACWLVGGLAVGTLGHTRRGRQVAAVD